MCSRGGCCVGLRRWRRSDCRASKTAIPVFVVPAMNNGKPCEHCGALLVPKVFPSGRREEPSMQRKRKYCNVICARRHRAEKTGLKPESGRKRAQTLYKATQCSECGGSSGRLDRHHRDGNTLNNSPGNIQVLCASCHTKLHWRQGKTHGRSGQASSATKKSAPAPTAPATAAPATPSQSRSRTGLPSASSRSTEAK